MEGIKPAFALAEVLDNFKRDAKLFDENVQRVVEGPGRSRDSGD